MLLKLPPNLTGWIRPCIFSLYKLQCKNLMLSDVEKGNNLMLKRLTPVATLIIIVIIVAIYECVLH